MSTSEHTNGINGKREIEQITQRQAILERSMWAGSKICQNIDHYVLCKDIDETDEDKTIYSFKKQKLRYPPALLKIIDEIIVNAIDQYTVHPTEVTKISIRFDKDTGEISVFNSGPGIEIKKKISVTTKEEMYSVQMGFAEMNAGSNMIDKEDIDRIVGGQNGLGAKITNVLSKKFTVETYDGTTNILYTQTFRDNLSVIEQPIIEHVTTALIGTSEKYQPHTKVTFIPDYETTFHMPNIKQYADTIDHLINTRAWEVSAFVGKSVTVFYNKAKIQLKSYSEFCEMFTPYKLISTKTINVMTLKPNKYQWDICIGISEHSKEDHISIINGIFVHNGGTHIQHLQSVVVTALKDRVIKLFPKRSGMEFKPTFITNNMFICMRGYVNKPEFSAQGKDALSNDVAQFADYTLPASVFDEIWKLLAPLIEASIHAKQFGDARTRTVSRVSVPKYREADLVRDRDKKKRLTCGLIIVEGDSARSPCNKALLNTKVKGLKDFSYTTYGTYILQGVTVNGLKESIIMKKADDEKAKTRIKKSTSSADMLVPPAAKDHLINKRAPNDKVTKNERLSSLIKVLNLDFNKTYKDDTEFATLRYGFVVGLLDQDLDGFNIFGLLATFFLTYWPALVGRGYVRRIITPLIRAYPKPKFAEKLNIEIFYDDREAQTWTQQMAAKHGATYVDEHYVTPFKYYKGLGTHDERNGEVSQMFSNINEKICEYILDKDAINAMYTYYGDDSSCRKIALSTPVDMNIKPNTITTLPLSIHYKTDTKAFQRSNIIRKLPNAIDGLIESRRMVLYTAIDEPKEIKVAGLVSKVIDKTQYAHGNDPLEGVVSHMAQTAPYSRNLPLLIGIGEFGSLAHGFDDYAQARYISCKLNQKLVSKMFRKEDMYILEYEVDAGKRYEPKYYVPIVPYALLETHDIPATGWAVCSYARDFKSVIGRIRERIAGKNDDETRLPYWRSYYKGEIRRVENTDGTYKSYFVGTYEYDAVNSPNLVTITELPPLVWSDRLKSGKKKSIASATKKEVDMKALENRKEYIDEIKDDTDEFQVNMKIYMKPGAIDRILSPDSKYGNQDFDPFEEFFCLKEPIHHRINMVNADGEVVSYKTYDDAFDYWFNIRKQLYAKRIDRERNVLTCERLLLTSKQIFVDAYKTLGLTKESTESEMIAAYFSLELPQLNTAIINNPSFTDGTKLFDLCQDPSEGASYDYLLDMKQRNMTAGATEQRWKEIEAINNRLAELDRERLAKGTFIGASIWLKELDELEQVVDLGLKTQWRYGECNYKYAEDINE